MALALNIGKCTLLGNYRENNEDAIEVKQFADMTISIVADGMGGQAAGEIASKRAIEVIPRELRKSVGSNADQDHLKSMFRKAVTQANEEIKAMGALDSDMRGMGTTVVAALWRKGPEIFVANVGDSRAYLIRDNTIEQLTVDHSLAQALVDNKTISAAEAREHRFKNVLWKFLGSKDFVDGPDVKIIAVKAGDRLLLCTDGLTGPVPDAQLLSFIKDHPDVQQCADGLGQLALDNGSRDNVSCIMIEVTGEHSIHDSSAPQKTAETLTRH
jgi:protein phosphatase